LKINAESFTNVHCPLVQTNEKRLFLEVKWYFDVDIPL
jgi:hypothetical protein